MSENLTSQTAQLPGASVFLAIRNEEPHLREAVAGILAQEYGGPLEIVMAVGPSTDRTWELAEELAAQDPRIKVVANPTGRTPNGLNIAIAQTTHEYLIRVDGHSLLPAGYIQAVVEHLEATGAANVGGMMLPMGRTPFEQAVAKAMSSPIGIGPAKFHTGGEPGPALTVYLGNFRKADLLEVGGFDEHFTRAQDWELNYRLRLAGKSVWFDPKLGVGYRPRGSWRALVKQFYPTGKWRRQVATRHRGTASLRYLAPPLAVTGVMLGLVLGVLGFVLPDAEWLRWAFVLPLAYLLGVGLASIGASRGLTWRAKLWFPVVVATMHMAWGLGYLVGIRDSDAK